MLTSYSLPDIYKTLMTSVAEISQEDVLQQLQVRKDFFCYGNHLIYAAIKASRFDLVETLIDFDHAETDGPNRSATGLVEAVCQLVSELDFASLTWLFETQLHKRHGVPYHRYRIFRSAIVADNVEMFKLVTTHYPYSNRDVKKGITFAVKSLSANIFVYLLGLKRCRYNTRELIEAAAYQFVDSYKRVWHRYKTGYEGHSKDKKAQIVAENRPKFELIFKTLVDSAGYLTPVSAQILKKELLDKAEEKVRQYNRYVKDTAFL